jgi:hypothetical protein
MIDQQHRSYPLRASSEIGINRPSTRATTTEPFRLMMQSNHSRNKLPPQRVSVSTDQHVSISVEDGPRNYAALRQFWHAWRAKAIRERVRENTQIEFADKFYKRVLLPLIFDTWKEKWRYFAVLQRRVERDRKRSVSLRCLSWWKYRTRLMQQQNERIHNKVVLRRMFTAWVAEVRMKRDQMNSVTLSIVMEKWKAKASTNKDLQTIADGWRQKHVLRQFWKEWFFRTCGVKTVQYHQIKLKQRSLARWTFKMRRSREMNRRARLSSRRRLISSLFTRWQDRTEAAIAREEQADIHRRRTILRVSVKAWLRNQQLSLRSGLFQDQVDNKLMNYAWKRWRMTTYPTILFSS